MKCLPPANVKYPVFFCIKKRGPQASFSLYQLCFRASFTQFWCMLSTFLLPGVLLPEK